MNILDQYEWKPTERSAFGDDVEDDLEFIDNLCKTHLGKPLDDTQTVDTETGADLFGLYATTNAVSPATLLYHNHRSYAVIDAFGTPVILSNWDGIIWAVK